MERSLGRKAASTLVQPWFAATLVAIGAGYTLGTVDTPPPATQAKLAPPSGFIGGTMKTLDEVEPRTPISERFLDAGADAMFVIDQPGSYYLPADLTVFPGAYGIKITAAPVTVDLMGHSVDGFGQSNDLVFIDALADRVTIKNGTLRRSGERGVDSYGDTVHLEMLEVIESRRSGVSLDIGRAATVRDVSIADAGTASGGDRAGFRVLGPGNVRARDMDITGTGGDGVDASASQALSLIDSYISDAGGVGVDAGDRAIVRSLRIAHTGSHGVRVGADAMVADTHVDNPGGDGIHAGSRSMIEKNRVYVLSSNAAPLGAAVMIVGDDAVVCHNVTRGGGSSFFGYRLNGDRNLLSCNRNYANSGYSYTPDNLIGRIITSVASYNTNNDPDANYDY